MRSRTVALTGVVPVLLAVILLAGCQSGDDPLAPGGSAGAVATGAVHGTQVLGPSAGVAVPGEVLVRVNAGQTVGDVNLTFATSTIREIAGTRYFALRVPEGASIADLATGMALSNLCEFAEPNYRLQAPEAERLSIAFYEGDFSHGDYIDQGALTRIGTAAAQLMATGAGVKVAVIDTGIDLDHPDLVDNIGPGYDFIDDDAFPEDLPNFIDDDGDGYIDEATGHGTHVAGIVALVAPEVTILPYRVLDSEGMGTAFDVAAAICRAVADGAQVINLSLGMDQVSEVMQRAIEMADAAGVVVLSSAGNRGVEAPQHFPASLNGLVMAVTATDAGDLKAPFANYGPHIDISAPGVGIMSTYWNGGYAVWSGTSMAVPFVAGSAALALEIDPQLTLQVEERIEENSFDLESQAFHDLLGEGRLQVDEMACDLTPGCDAGGGDDLTGGGSRARALR